MDCDNNMKSNQTMDINAAEHVYELCTGENKLNTVLPLSLWNLACNKLNQMYGGDTSKGRQVYYFVTTSRGYVGSKSNSTCITSKDCESQDEMPPEESEENIDTSLKVVCTISTEIEKDNRKQESDSHSDTETEQSASKSCTLFDTNMSYDSKSESSSDEMNDHNESPVFIPNKESSSTKSLLQSKEKLKEIDISKDSVEIIDVSVKVKVEPEENDNLTRIKNPLLIDITNGENTDETNYNDSSMEPPSGSQITGDKGNKNIITNISSTYIPLKLGNECNFIPKSICIIEKKLM